MSEKKRICVVDRGKICRSPVAEVLIGRRIKEAGLQERYLVNSFRTQGSDPNDLEPPRFPSLTYYEDEYRLTSGWLKQRNIDLSGLYSEAITSWFAEKASVIFALDERTKESLFTMFPHYKQKIHLLSETVNLNTGIADPEKVKDENTMNQILNELEQMVENGFPNILKFAEGNHPQENGKEGDIQNISLGRRK